MSKLARCELNANTNISEHRGGHEVEVHWAHHLPPFRISSDKYLLYSLLEQGLDIQYQCLEGHCGACEVTLVEGGVEYDVFYQHHAPKLDVCQGSREESLELPLRHSEHIRPCICYPTSDKLILTLQGG